MEYTCKDCVFYNCGCCCRWNYKFVASFEEACNEFKLFEEE